MTFFLPNDRVPTPEEVSAAVARNDRVMADLDKVKQAGYPGSDLVLGMWLASPHEALGGRPPWQAITEGDVDSVVALIQGMGT